MAKFNVTMTIEFAGEIEADSEHEAEQLAWTSWGDTYDNPIQYQCVESIDVEEIEEEEEEEA